MKQEVKISITTPGMVSASALDESEDGGREGLSSTFIIIFTVVSSLMTLYILANVIETCRKYKAMARNHTQNNDDSVQLQRR